MQVMTLIEKQAIDQDMIQADINSLSPRPPSAACSPSNGGLKNVLVKRTSCGYLKVTVTSRRLVKSQMRVKPEKWRNACLSAVSSFKNTRLRICNLHKCWQLTIVATFAMIVIARFNSSATSWMNFNTRMNIWTRWIELERTWGLSYWLYQPKNWVL